MKTKTAVPPNEPIIVMSRDYDAPRDLLWRVMTDPAHVAKWWGGEGIANPRCEMDVRPGGDWHHVMRFANGDELPLHYVFLEVDAPARLVWQHADHGTRAGGMPTTHITLTLEALGDRRTRWTMVARFTSLAMRDLAVEHGFTRPIAASNDFLVGYLESLETA